MKLLWTLLSLIAFPVLAAAPIPQPLTQAYPTHAPLSVSSASARVALPTSSAAFPGALLINDGASELFWKCGDVTVVATTTNIPLPPGASMNTYVGGCSYIAAITASGTTMLRIVQTNGAF